MERKAKFVFGMFFIAALVLTSWGEQAQAQPKISDPAIDIIVSMGPGGATDLSTRVMGSHLSKIWGVPINVINKPGGTPFRPNWRC